MGLYGKRIKVALKGAGGTMYFVTGIKLSTDATVETRQEEEGSVAGNVAVNATQITGLGTLGTAGSEQGQVLSGWHIQKELERATTADIKGERIIAVEYYCVQLQRKLELLPAKPTHKLPATSGGVLHRLFKYNPVELYSSSQDLSAMSFGEYPKIRSWDAKEKADEDGDPQSLVVYPTEGGLGQFQQETLAINNKYNLVELLPSELNESLELLFGENPWGAERLNCHSLK